MTLGEFRTLIRLYVPGAKLRVVPNATLNILINRGVDDVNSFTKAYQANKKFNVVAEQQEYNIVDNVDDFILMDRPGIWWNSGTQWQRIFPKTRLWLDKHTINWRDFDSDAPMYYFQEKDVFGFSPKPDTSLVNGFWIYYIKAATAMTEDGHFPFTGSTTELTILRDLDDAIIDYVRWKLARPLGKDAAGTLKRSEYFDELKRKKDQINRRPDVVGSSQFRMRIGRSYPSSQ